MPHSENAWGRCRPTHEFLVYILRLLPILEGGGLREALLEKASEAAEYEQGSRHLFNRERCRWVYEAYAFMLGEKANFLSLDVFMT